MVAKAMAAAVITAAPIEIATSNSTYENALPESISGPGLVMPLMFRL